MDGSDQLAKLHQEMRESTIAHQFTTPKPQDKPTKPSRKKGKPGRKQKQKRTPGVSRMRCSSCYRVEEVPSKETYRAARVRCSYCGGPLNWFSQT